VAGRFLDDQSAYMVSAGRRCYPASWSYGMASTICYDYVLMRLPEEVLCSVHDLVQAVSDESLDYYEQLICTRAA
jgi:hypothetical protein